MITSAVFLGSKKFGLSLFKALYEADPTISWTILCPPDLNDMRTCFSEFQDYAKLEDIDLLIANSPAMIEQYVLDNKPEVMVVCGYYRILSGRLIENVKLGVWGIHNSLLPKYRGGSPLVWQLINREKVIGSSFFKFTNGMDDGVILDQVKIENAEKMTIGEASDSVERAWISKIPEIWVNFCKGDIHLTEQNHTEASYCALRQEADGLIDWKLNATDIDAFIRAQDAPYPRAFFTLNEKVVKIVSHSIDSREIYGTCGQVFQIIEKSVVICCGGGTAIQVSKVLSDGSIVDASEILNSIKIRLR
ncbi:methionyl-tRNA formyltransferase [Terasakiella pusilla]|uniref:methionyl-tRNA formyltransferase n=1 Tax=Terasakiella pusilla TaxID=64973 RepID=UPI003AA848B8